MEKLTFFSQRYENNSYSRYNRKKKGGTQATLLRTHFSRLYTYLSTSGNAHNAVPLFSGEFLTCRFIVFPRPTTTTTKTTATPWYHSSQCAKHHRCRVVAVNKTVSATNPNYRATRRGTCQFARSRESSLNVFPIAIMSSLL